MKSDVTAIVPCYNEAERIGAVLEALTSSPEIGRIVVVDDGSVDNSREVIRQYNVELVCNERNLGQGESVRIAAQQLTTNVVLLCDADLIGLKPEHISALVAPVIDNPKVMTVALLDKYWHLGSKALKKHARHITIIPITGTRALRTEYLLKACSNRLFGKYGIHPVINHACRKSGVKMVRVSLNGVRDVVKTRKKHYGLKPHIQETINITGVYSQLYLGEAKSYITALPRRVKQKIRYSYTVHKKKLGNLLRNF